MDIQWLVGADDVARVEALIKSQSDNALVRMRRKINLADTKPPITKERFWRAMVCMRLTTQQRSGPKSHVVRFIRKNPFPLAYSTTRSARPTEGFITDTLRAAGGIRFCDKIASELTRNLAILENGEWAQALERCNQLARPVSRDREAAVAEYIDQRFNGFGPKQARNFLQSLGLTRYEIPIDSRVTDWLNRNGVPMRLSATALADNNYYRLVSEGVQALCDKAEIFPCILDAAVFALGYSGDWTEAELIF